MDHEKKLAVNTLIHSRSNELRAVHDSETLPVVILHEQAVISLRKFTGIRHAETGFSRNALDKYINRVIKRVADLAVSTFIILFLLSWLIPVLAILIKLDSKGPVFFLQKRNKKGGKEFTCIKFRSMIHGNNPDQNLTANSVHNITRFGRFLRNHFIDELPQFFNVWWGDMSLIGPRPHMIDDNLKFENLVDNYQYRQEVKPGITGLAQVLGFVGPVTDIKQIKDRIYLDNYYIRNWSFLLDIKIFFSTFLRIAGI